MQQSDQGRKTWELVLKEVKFGGKGRPNLPVHKKDAERSNTSFRNVIAHTL